MKFSPPLYQFPKQKFQQYTAEILVYFSSILVKVYADKNVFLNVLALLDAVQINLLKDHY